MASNAADTAERYVGLQEVSYNRSPDIDRFNREANVPIRSSWCMAFQHHNYLAAARSLGVTSPLMRTGSVSMQLRYAKQIGSKLQVIPIAKVLGASLAIERGDLLCAKHGVSRQSDIGRMWLGHVEMGIHRDGSYVETIGGNTSSGRRGSQRDGDGVFRRRRPLNFFLAVIRVPTSSYA